MTVALTIIAVIAALPAALSSNDEWAVTLGLNALIWAGAGMAVA